jgi:hypothetical protein
MITWYNGLNLIQRIYALIAIPSTAVLLIQTIMLFFGLGDNDGGADGADADTGGFDQVDGFDGDSDAGSGAGDDGLTLFSVRGIMALLCIGGWSGIVINEAGAGLIVTVLLSTLIGSAALVGMAMLIKLLLKLQSAGNVQLSSAVGKVGQVYLTIPPNMSGMGKVNLTVQDRYSEFSAMTADDKKIKTGEMIRVVASDDIGYLVVERLPGK